MYICAVLSMHITFLVIVSVLQLYRSVQLVFPFLLQHLWSFFLYSILYFMFFTYSLFLFFGAWKYFRCFDRQSLVLYMNPSLHHLVLLHFIYLKFALLCLVWLCWTFNLLSWFVVYIFLFSILVCVAFPLPLPFSATNPTISGLLSCEGNSSSAVVSNTLSFSKLNFFLVYVHDLNSAL